MLKSVCFQVAHIPLPLINSQQDFINCDHNGKNYDQTSHIFILLIDN